jgi:hypothetical protein
MTTINRTPVSEAGDESVPSFSSLEGSTLSHRPLSETSAQEGQSSERDAIASMTRWLNRW